MKKLCILLINELRRLGAHIVYADLSRIIVCTNKLTVNDALPYMEYLLKNLQSKDLFNTIHIDTNKVWTLLMWNDSANYAGIKLDLNGSEDDKTTSNGSQNISDTASIEMNWKISSFLPDIVQENFKALIAGYLGNISDKIAEQSAEINDQTSQPIDSLEANNNTKENLVKHSQNLVSGELTEQLMRLTMKIYKVR
jgi:DNA polymerase epsilon subunit 1